MTKSTVFIESFFEELQQQGIAVATDVLEFRMVPADHPVDAYFDYEESNVIKLTRLRYVRDSFDQGPIVLATSYVSGQKSFLFRYDFGQVSLTSALKENGYQRVSMKKNITAVNLTLRESRLLGVQDGSLAIKIISVSRDDHGKIVDACESLYPVDRIEFTLELQL